MSVVLRVVLFLHTRSSTLVFLVKRGVQRGKKTVPKQPSTTAKRTVSSVQPRTFITLLALNVRVSMKVKRCSL